MKDRTRRGAAVLVSVLSLLLVWLVLTTPPRIHELGPAAFLRLPAEALVFVGLVLVLPSRAALVLATVVGVLLGLVGILKVLDMGFVEALNRPFDLVMDWQYAGSLFGLVRDSFGPTTGTIMLVVSGIVLLAVLALVPLSVRRLTRLLRRHRPIAARTTAVLAVVWVVLALTGVHDTTGAAVASTAAADYAYGQVSRVPEEVRDQRAFEAALRTDALRDRDADTLLNGLRGKDVLIVFVESYGRIAIEESSFAPDVVDLLDSGTSQLEAAGFSSRSAFLTSPTFGAISWLAHATLQSGLWVDSQQRYDTLVKSRRSTLSRAFERAGWRTVSDSPANTRDWPEGRFYGFDHFYDSRNVGYAGPRFGYPTMPDQYTLDAFHRLELAERDRPPVMAEIDLISSHAPWSRTPRMIPPNQVGDGSVFEGMPEQAPSKTVIWRSPERVRAAYGEAIEYSLSAVISFVKTYSDDDTVLVVVGDHQPARIVSGARSGHDVPITVIARDKAVLDRITGWGWHDGLRPRPDAPVWRMDAFRDRFLEAFAR